MVAGSEAAMLQLAGCLERTSKHPIAAAIAGHAAAAGAELSLTVSSSEAVPGGAPACVPISTSLQ
jgi:cation transport ATPase